MLDELLRTSDSHNSIQQSHIVKLMLHFMLILGGSLSHKTIPVQAHCGFRLLTLASYKYNITENYGLPVTKV